MSMIEASQGPTSMVGFTGHTGLDMLCGKAETQSVGKLTKNGQGYLQGRLCRSGGCRFVRVHAVLGGTFGSGNKQQLGGDVRWEQQRMGPNAA